ncbi:MAG TPA: phage major capsid protein [Terriglobales bacterium]|nr:phage major capsid protein [Terriglobales bacterium]
MSLSTRLRQERGQIVEEMRKLCDSKNAADAARWRELDAKQEELRIKIQTAETNRLDEELHMLARDPERPLIVDHNNYAISTDARSLNAVDEVRAKPEYRKAFREYLTTGERHELRTYTPLGSISPADGSTLVPVGFQKEVDVHMKAIGGLRLCARIITTPQGNSLQWPTEEDTSNAGHWMPQNSGPVAQTNPTFSNVTLGSDLLSSDQVLVPVELFQDSAFSIEALLTESFGIRLGRGTASAYMNGNGANIVGLLPTLTAATPSRAVAAVGANPNSGNSGDTAANSLGSDDFANAITAVDPAYRLGPRVGFLANQSTFDKMRNVKDKYGRPIWQVSLSEGQPDKIMGYPYWYDQSMQLIGSGHVPLIFGDFAKYIIRDVLGMTVVRYNELYMVNHQLGYEAFMRTFGQVLNAQAFSYIQQ